MTDDIPRPYTMDEQPTSPGRVLLARAIAHWCALHHGCTEAQVEAALGAGEDLQLRRLVRDSARLIGELAAAGTLRTFARPRGGGEAIPLKPAVWELDDFRPRMASSGIDPRRPFDADADPTHWVFLDLQDFNSVVAASCGEAPGAGPGQMSDSTVDAGPETSAAPSPQRAPRLLRLPEVKARTGMGRSTIYNRIRDQAFPAPVNLGGNISGWHESEVVRWIEERGR